MAGSHKVAGSSPAGSTVVRASVQQFRRERGDAGKVRAWTYGTRRAPSIVAVNQPLRLATCTTVPVCGAWMIWLPPM